ncbi:hypothetical protein JVX93_16090 [Mycolicibacterium boenickei]|nr:hypothetical protein JVX93_16090 [Mycolicibacterium boenickei]
MDGYAAGSVKHHPDWPATPIIARRTAFDDNDATGCLSWLEVSDSALYRTETYVADWPDVEGLTLRVEVTPAP